MSSLLVPVVADIYPVGVMPWMPGASHHYEYLLDCWYKQSEGAEVGNLCDYIIENTRSVFYTLGFDPSSDMSVMVWQVRQLCLDHLFGSL